MLRDPGDGRRNASGLKPPLIARRGAMLLLAAPALAQGQRTQVGEVAALTGTAAARFNGGPPRSLVLQSPVLHRDLISTGPNTRLSARLISGAFLRLGENASLEVDDLVLKGPNAGTRLRSSGGPILFDRPSGISSDPVTLELPWARIGVRGTRFVVGPLDGAFIVFVERGSVEVTGVQGDGAFLTAGQGVDLPVLPGAVAPPPGAVMPAPGMPGPLAVPPAAPGIPGVAPQAGTRGIGRPVLAVRTWTAARIARAMALVD